ncbi:MAG: hypothetical protein ABI190_02055, partial [Casimicrobiaceae bacterium]
MRDDQAQGLRKLFVRGAVPACAISGVGGESAVLAIARAFAAGGERVLLLDRSRGKLAACAGKRARHELWHVLEGDVRIGDVTIALDDHLDLVPAARGLDLLAADRRDWRDGVTDVLGTTRPAYDLWIVHGLPPSIEGCDSPLFTVTPTRTSVTHVYAQIKALAQAQGREHFGVIATGARGEAEARALFDGLAATTRRFLGIDLDYCGALPMDVRGSVAAGDAV